MDNVKFDLWRKMRAEVARRSGQLFETPYVVTLLRPFGPPDLTHCALWITTIMKS